MEADSHKAWPAVDPRTCAEPCAFAPFHLHIEILNKAEVLACRSEWICQHPNVAPHGASIAMSNLVKQRCRSVSWSGFCLMFAKYDLCGKRTGLHTRIGSVVLFWPEGCTWNLDVRAESLLKHSRCSHGKPSQRNSLGNIPEFLSCP